MPLSTLFGSAIMRLIFGFGVSLLGLLLFSVAAQAAKSPIRVVVWDERQPAQQQVYPNFLGNHIADYLREHGAGKDGGDPEITVRSVGLDDPDQGLSKETLDNCDVLIWWGHIRHADVKDELAKEIVRRVEEGRLSLISLHSAHWSKPFIAAMEARSVQDALNSLPKAERAK